MKTWLRKSLMVLVSILSFGIVTPSHFTTTVNAERTANSQDAVQSAAAEGGISQQTAFLEESEFDRDTFMEALMKQAEEQSYQKFGRKIKPVIEDEFRGAILPNIEKALQEMAAQYPEEDLKNLSISEQPGKGISEKIFNVKNNNTGKDILRFHVRRDNPPQSGYWFNFHYHTYHDDFQGHYDLGSIYWDKNTPPNWMS